MGYKDIPRNFIKSLRNLARDTEETLTEEQDVYLVGTSPRKKGEAGWSHLEERVTKTVPLDKLEKLYRLDPLTFRIVNDYVTAMIGPGYFLEGDPEVVEELTTWAENMNLKHILEEIVRDCFLAGGAWIELGYQTDGKDILKVRSLNPKYMDFIRDPKNQYVKLDKSGNPVGYVRKPIGIMQEVKWTKDKIEIGGKTEQRITRGDGRDRVAYFKLWSLGESYLGCTPLESAYRQAIVRLNISRNAGEGAFRSEGLIIKVGDEGEIVSNEQVDKVAEQFEDIETDTIFAFKRSPNVEIDRLPSPELAGREKLLYYFADIFCTGLGKPLALLMEPLRGARTGAVEKKAVEWEFKVRALQERLATQVRDKIFYRVMDARGINRDRLQRVVFKSNMSSIKLAKARRIATLARRALIRWDPELEKWLRQLEDLPVNILDDLIEEYEKTGNIPGLEASPEQEVRVRLDELEEEIEKLKAE